LGEREKPGDGPVLEIFAPRFEQDRFGDLVATIQAKLSRYGELNTLGTYSQREIDPNIEQTFKFDCEFPEIRALSSLVEVFLFDGKNMPVATNRSRGLQRLSSEQVEEFRELQKKQGKK